MKQLGGFVCCADKDVYHSQWWKLTLWSSVLWHCIVWYMGNKFWHGKLPPFSGYEWTRLGEWLLICKWAPEGSTGQSLGKRAMRPRLANGNHRPRKRELFQGKWRKNFPSAGIEGKANKESLRTMEGGNERGLSGTMGWSKPSMTYQLGGPICIPSGCKLKLPRLFLERTFLVKGPVSKSYINDVFTGQ